MDTKSSRPLAVFCGPLDGQSTARIAARLANGFAARGQATDLLISRGHQQVPEPLHPRVRLIDLGRLGALNRLPRLLFYLLRRRPRAILTQRPRENILTLKAVALSRLRIPVLVTVHGPLSVKLDHLPRRRSSRWRQVRHWYRRNRRLIAISEETAEDLRNIFGASARIQVIANPIVTPDLFARAAEPPGHPWLGEGRRAGAGPVILAAGRLEREKDFATLLQAMALVRAQRACRLLIVGEGRLRGDLEAERSRLGLDAAVELPGWTDNPYPYLRAADLVVLSSIWDALPTVLIEALALGTPVVSTACGAGPVEILQAGALGPLVPPRDPAALAGAILAALEHPLPPEVLRAGADRYDAQRNADRYLEWMLEEPE